MGISFVHPYTILFFIPAIYLVFIWWRRQTRMRAIQRNGIASLRFLLLSVLILALAETSLVYPVQGESIVFVVDQSASMKQDQRALQFIQQAIKEKGPNDQYGIVAVGQQAAVEQPLTKKPDLTALGVEVGPHATNLEEGIRLASGMLPSTARGKIILLTDGLATHGDAVQEASLLTQQQISLQAVSLQQPAGDEVVLSTVQVPNRLYQGEEFQIKASVESTIATRGTLRIYEGSHELATKQVVIEQGSNQFVIPQQNVLEGFHRYRVELIPEQDTIQLNNQAYAFTQAQGTPRILIVEGHTGAAKNLQNALQAGVAKVDVIKPEQLPQELEDYRAYSSIVLANVDATSVRTGDMERIRTAVSDFGVGLIMTGGAESFGMGGWFQTPVEEALPVHMDLRGKKQIPSLGLVLVIDKSGSMTSGDRGVNKMALAREAAIRATEMLQPKDQVSVVAFDGSPWLVVPPQNMTNLVDIHQQISRIQADGGTEIYPALVMAVEQLKQMNVQRKHVILLTDGQSGRSADYLGLLQQMTADNVTVSTVAVGNDADTALLQDIAQAGKGRYYLATDPQTIPQIFSKETAMASRAFIVEKPQVPLLVNGGGWSSLAGGIPQVHAYLTTSPKQTAEPILLSADQDPILIRWQYGLGRAVAWTSDLEGAWAPEWVLWGGFGRFWNEVVSWTFPQVTLGQWTSQTSVDGVNGKIEVTWPPGTPAPQQLSATVIHEEKPRQQVTLKPIAPGKWSGTYDASTPGSYLIQIVQKQGEKVVAAETTGLTVAYSPEYSLQRDGDRRLQEIVAVAKGQLITDPAQAFASDLPAKWEQQPINDVLLQIAMILLLLDIAARRLTWPDELPAWMMFRLKRTRVKSMDSSAKSSMLSQLQTSKERVQQKATNVTSKETSEIDQTVPSENKQNYRTNAKPTPKQPSTPVDENTQTSSNETLNRLLGAKKRRS